MIVPMLPVLLLTMQGSAAADPLPNEMPAVALNRNIEMIPVKGGCYKMGDASEEGEDNERPVHEVCVKDFLIGKYPVMQTQWIGVTGKNPSAHANCGHFCPVENVSWDEIQAFLRKLKDRTGKQYRLLTEAEWEYAARSGGKDEKWAGTSVEVELGDFAWYLANSQYKSHPVATRKPNGLGIYDMTGNVWQWTSDRYQEDYYATSPRDNPPGPAEGEKRVLRGGFWGSTAPLCRTARRIGVRPDAKAAGYGFRVALSPE